MQRHRQWGSRDIHQPLARVKGGGTDAVDENLSPCVGSLHDLKKAVMTPLEVILRGFKIRWSLDKFGQAAISSHLYMPDSLLHERVYASSEYVVDLS